MTVIYDPACPPRIFDGLLDVYSTCRDCGTLMRVIHAHEHSHPTCAEVEPELDSLYGLLAMETESGDSEQAELTKGIINDRLKLQLGAAAADYADWQWPVFPLADRTKVPAIPKRRGGQGFKDATTDRKRIDRRWERFPRNNIGLATGHEFDVIDIDTKDKDGNPTPQGINSLMDLLHTGNLPETHAIAVTASGGMHLYVKATGKGCFAGIRPGVDYRGKGGYVVAPPSVLKTPGSSYTWLVEPSPIIKGERF